MSKYAIGRRSMLRGIVGGLAASIALPPLLEVLDGNGTAYADGTALPRPFGMFFWGNGVSRVNGQGVCARWIPKTTGTGWAITPELQPFADAGLANAISVVSGTRVVPAPGADATDHHRGRVTMISGSAVDGPYYDYGSPKVHEIVANQWKGQTRIDKLDIAISEMGFGPYPVEPFGQADPQALFDSVFSMKLPENTTAEQAKAARQAMMSALLMDGNALLPKLGVESKHQLNQTLDAWNSLSKRVATAAPVCSGTPARPNAAPYVAGHEQIEYKSQTMADILSVALACDLTRAFFFRFDAMQADTVYWPLGITRGHHDISHDGPQEGQDMIFEIIKFTMKQLAYLANKLKAIPIGGRTLLDQSCIMGTTEQSEGGHGTDDMPIVLVGSAGGKLKTGYHYRSTTNENATKAHLTCLHAVNVPVPSFGLDGQYILGKSTSTISTLEV